MCLLVGTSRTHINILESPCKPQKELFHTGITLRSPWIGALQFEIAPVTLYTITIIYLMLTFQNWIKSEILFRKVLCVPKYAPIRLVYAVAKTDYFVLISGHPWTRSLHQRKGEDQHRSYNTPTMLKDLIKELQL